jgi:hypothetical protein
MLPKRDCEQTKIEDDNESLIGLLVFQELVNRNFIFYISSLHLTQSLGDGDPSCLEEDPFGSI